MNNLTWLYENGPWIFRNVVDALGVDYTVEHGIKCGYTTSDWLLAEHEGECGESKPAPVLAADGKPIEAGQVLYGEDGMAWKVEGFNAAKAPHTVRGACRTFGHHGEVRALKPEWLTHEQPESARRIIADMSADCAKRCGASADEFEVFLQAYASRIEALTGGGA